MIHARFVYFNMCSRTTAGKGEQVDLPCLLSTNHTPRVADANQWQERGPSAGSQSGRARTTDATEMQQTPKQQSEQLIK